MTGMGVLAAEKFWILDPLYNSLGTLLAWFYGIVPSYGVAIMLLTVAVRIITLPLTAKQARSQQQMQRVAPELKRLQAKYKHDKQKLNEEMMRFYKENHVNPLGGCLPVLIQAPVLIVLYRLILDLTAKPDPKHIPRSSALFESLKESAGTMVSWGIDLAQSAAEVSGSDKFPYLLLVAAVVATGYLQQKQLTARVSPENVNPQMAMMTKIFPVMFGFISFTIPAGVVVYFLVSNIWQIGQQAVLFRNQPVPEPAKDKADKDTAGKDGADKAAKSGGKPGSGAKGKAGIPPAKGKGAGSKGSKGPGSPRPGAGKGAGKRPAAGSPKARGGPPARSGGKGSGKPTPGNRPSGRVTPPKRGQSPGKGKPAVKGTAQARPGPAGRAGGADGGDAGRSQRWWQKLRPATTPAPPAPTSDGGRPSAGAPATKAGGGGRPKPKPKTGAGKGPAAGTGPSTAGRPEPKVGTPAKDTTAGPAPAEASADPTAGDAGARSGSGNGQTRSVAAESEASPGPAPNPPATNGSGDARAQSGDAAPGPGEPAAGTAGEGLNPDGEPGTRLPDEVQEGEE